MLPTRRPRTRHIAILVSGLVAATAGLSGCGTATVSCASWASYESPAQMERDADVIVTTASVESSGSADLFGVAANRYEVLVTGAEKGDATPGSTIEVVSTPDSCGADLYPEGDPLDTSDSVRLYLVRDDRAGLRTLTPFDGVEPATPGA